jgi:hypothetical protein
MRVKDKVTNSAYLTPADFSGRAARLATEEIAVEPVTRSALKGRGAVRVTPSRFEHRVECDNAVSWVNSRLTSRSP